MSSLVRVARHAVALWAMCAALVLAPAAARAAGAFPPDAVGSVDHPLIKRYAGSALIGFKASDWDQTTLPLNRSEDKDKLKEKLVVEGKITRLMYLSPQGKTPLEVFRNYEQALNAAGFKKKFGCENDCGDLYFAWGRAINDSTLQATLKWSTGGVPAVSGSPYQITWPITHEGGRMLVGSISKGGKELNVLLYTSYAHSSQTDSAVTYIEIIEPKAMPTGQVAVDAKAIQGGLQADGKIALYGLFFDTGKAEIKPVSKAQLDEMAKVLQAQAALKVYIVGHTDSQGALDANLALSQQRAQAVVAALTGSYKIDAKRLQARGVASLVPVSSNADDEGRARNRRVELVAQ